MKLRMIVDMSGSRDGEDWPKRGEVADFDADEAADLIAAGIAVKHEGKAPLESAAEDTEPAKRGEVADFDADEAADLIAAGIAVKHEGKAPLESAAEDTEPAKRGRAKIAAKADED